MTFDVAAKKGLKKRFFVEHVATDGSQDSGSTLFMHDDKTEVSFVESVAEPTEAIATQEFNMRLGADRIGGLSDQIADLNRRLHRLCIKAKSQNQKDGLPWNSSLLLHGYEGTGKSLIIEELQRNSGAKKTVRLEKRQLLGTASKNDAVIQSAFNEALANQPSLVLIDNLEQIAASGDAVLRNTIDSLCTGFDSIVGTGVLVVAATRDKTAIDSALIAPKRFSKTIELPVPDSAARVDIVRALFHAEHSKDESLYSNVGSRTHGFTGKDLGQLVWEAMDSALERHVEEHEEWVKVQAQSATSQSTEVTLVDDGNQEQAASSDESTAPSRISVTLEDFESALRQVRPTALREIILETPKVTWNDIGGSDRVKERFDTIVGWPMLHSDILAEYGRLKWQKGALLYGPPGCSKTMTAQAVANTYGLNFIAVKGAELISMYVGESERAVREIFRKARAAAPSIIFFDEIDAIGSTRESGSSSGLNVLTTLLNEMDGFELLKGVQVLAATNKPESLDPALLRPGRFDAHIYLGPPTGPARRDILTISTKGLTLKEDVSLEDLVIETEGYSGAEIVSACDLAVQQSIGRAIKGSSDRSICKADFETGFAATAKGITAEMLEAYDAFAQRAAKR